LTVVQAKVYELIPWTTNIVSARLSENSWAAQTLADTLQLKSNLPLVSVSCKVSTNGFKKVEKKGFSSPNHRPPNILNLFFLL